ncbi:hypothetical protein M23134_05383 [Microscilla marina ATCC 23134]|uniref:Uncharacterized protein n=1 Tax=Microscilla marina ATCC 23134 TaxID=313606 RepID=A1ZHP3_MICM2|nr:hypothetical protein M23134_05383 [Microscilla marina ATCC 23134]
MQGSSTSTSKYLIHYFGDIRTLTLLKKYRVAMAMLNF